MSRLARLRPVAHDDRLNVVSHLDELRTRMIVSLLVLGVAFGLCFWQNHRLLALIDSPLAHQTQRQVRDGNGPLGATFAVQQRTREVAVDVHRLVGVLAGQPSLIATRGTLRELDDSLRRDIGRLSVGPHGDRPITLGIGEPFTTTATVALIFALILSLPILLWQAWAFLMPALDPIQRQRVRSLTLAIPGLFIAGVVFGYFVVLPAAVRFFQNFNSDQFNVLVQASQYYKFAATTILAMGLLFEVPVLILGVTRAGLIAPRQLQRNRRYAVAVCALVAALLPGDAVTMLLETVPLYVLFEAGVLLAALAERRAQRAAPLAPAAAGAE